MTQDDSTTTASNALDRLSNVDVTASSYNNCGSVYMQSSVHGVYRASYGINTRRGETFKVPPTSANARAGSLNGCGEVIIKESAVIIADRKIVKDGDGEVIAEKSSERGSTLGAGSFVQNIKRSFFQGNVDPQAMMDQTPDASTSAASPEETESGSSSDARRPLQPMTGNPLPWVLHSEAQEHTTEGESGDVSTPPSAIQTEPEPDSLGESAGPFSRQSGSARPSPLPWGRPARDEGTSMHVDPVTGNRTFTISGPVSITKHSFGSSAPDFKSRMQSGGSTRTLGATMNQLGKDLSKHDWGMYTRRN